MTRYEIFNEKVLIVLEVLHAWEENAHQILGGRNEGKSSRCKYVNDIEMDRKRGRLQSRSWRFG